MIVDLGCGEEKVQGAIGVDNVQLNGVDLVHDLLDFPYPFEDASVKEVYLRHVVEHFRFAEITAIFNETFRILEPGGTMYVRVPHVFSTAAWIDPTHQHGFTFETGRFFDRAARKGYYKDLPNQWLLKKTAAHTTLMNWKMYRLRQVDRFFGGLIDRVLNYLLSIESWPGAADLLVKILPVFFVEICWDFVKPVEGR